MEGFFKITQDFKDKVEDIKGIYERVKAILTTSEGKTIKQFFFNGKLLTDAEIAAEAQDFY